MWSLVTYSNYFTTSLVLQARLIWGGMFVFKTVSLNYKMFIQGIFAVRGF